MGTYLKPAYTLLSDCHSQLALSCNRQTRTMVQKVSCLRTANTFNLNTLRSYSHADPALARFYGLAIAEVQSSWNIWMRWFEIYDKWSVQTSIDRYTRVRNAVMLVWGSLRLAPINCGISDNYYNCLDFHKRCTVEPPLSGLWTYTGTSFYHALSLAT